MISYITFEYVLEIHDKLIEEYGGRKGILSEGLLRSALEAPKASFGGKDFHRTVFDKTAAYLFLNVPVPENCLVKIYQAKNL